MLASFMHPSPRHLVAFALGDLPESTRRRRVQAHLAHCSACRGVVTANRTLGIEALNLHARMTPRADTLQRILSARAAGERVLLPGAAPAVASGNRRWLAAAAIGGVAILGLFFQPSQRAIASEAVGALSFLPAQPSHGGTVVVRYAAPATLSGNDSLILRVRFRTRWGAPYLYAAQQVVATRLGRAKNGEYTGQFTLPRDVVYAVFAVENPSADRIDANAGRFWELLVFENGKPTLSALQQQFNDLLARSPDSALSIARQTATSYPNSPAALSGRFAFEGYMLGPAVGDTALAVYRRRFRELDRALRGHASVDAETITGMLGFAAQVSDRDTPDITEARAYWRQRLAADGSGSPLVGYRTISDFNSSVLRDTTLAHAALDSVEQLWQRGDSVGDRTWMFGLQIAQRTHEPTAILRWIDRLAREQPRFEPTYLVESVRREPQLRKTAITRVRAFIARMNTRDDAHRPLDATLAEDRRLRDEEARRTSVLLGDLLLQDGDTTGGVAAMRSATTGGWDVDLFSRVGTLALRLRDTATAARAIAFVATDPATPRARADSLARRLGDWLGTERAATALADAGREMTRRVMASSFTRGVPRAATARIARDSGPDTTLGAVTRGRVSIVVFWSRFCGFSRMQLSSYRELAAQLEQRGVGFIPIAVEAPSDAVNEFLATAKIQLASLYDIHGEARAAFDNIATPTYYVLDRDGRLRFSGNSPSLALTQAVALDNDR